MGVVDKCRVKYLIDSRLLLDCWLWWKRKSVSEILKKPYTMSWKQIHRICYLCGTLSWGLRTPFRPHTAGAVSVIIVMTMKGH